MYLDDLGHIELLTEFTTAEFLESNQGKASPLSCNILALRLLIFDCRKK